jgi:Fic-DOC domain mobile mystery protein B
MQSSPLAPGATALDPDEAQGLIPGHIHLQADLNIWEEANILEGQRWLLRQVKSGKRVMLQEDFVRELHRRMFDQTWQWAGQFRRSDKNIGVEWPHIATRLRNLLDNTQFQIQANAFTPDEQAIRFHHQLVWIHPFPNGNGRHARLMADALIMHLGQARFTWGQAPLEAEGGARANYLAALREADQGNYARLIAFSRQ